MRKLLKRIAISKNQQNNVRTDRLNDNVPKVKYWLWQPKAKDSLYLMPGEVIMLQHDGRWTTAKLESRRTVY